MIEEEEFNKKSSRRNYKIKDADDLKKSKLKSAQMNGVQSSDLIYSGRVSDGGATDAHMTPSEDGNISLRQSIMTNTVDSGRRKSSAGGEEGYIKSNRELIQTQDVNIEIISSHSSVRNLNY